MENTRQYKMDPDNEKILDKISGIYKRQSESLYIQNMVKRKINESNFFNVSGKKSVNVLNYLTAPLLRYAVAASIVLFFVVTVFFIFNDTNTQNNEHSPTALIDSSGDKIIKENKGNPDSRKLNNDFFRNDNVLVYQF